MPLLWRYLLKQYLTFFFLSIAAFIIILMTMRLDEIASFATLGASVNEIIWFTIQQIPYILPIAIPISSLISALLLIQNMSQAKELTALRSCGISIKRILTPILIASIFISLINFYVISELSTTSHKNMNLLKNHLRSINPLLLLHNKHIMRMRGFYFDALGPSYIGEYAYDVLFFSQGKKQERIRFMTAKKLESTLKNFLTEQMTLLNTQKIQENEPETKVLENMKKSTLQFQDFSHLLEQKIDHVNYEHMRFTSLIKQLNFPYKNNHQVLVELLRRISVSIAVVSFTLMGLSFGIQISRKDSYKNLFIVIFLSVVYLSAFFIAKNFDTLLLQASLLYLIPHLIICLFSLRALYKISYGIE